MDADVIVAGAGPVGLLLAAELALAGCRPVVVERLAVPAEQEKARGIGVLATELLWRRGLGDQLAEAHLRGTADFARDHGTSRGHVANIHKLDADPHRQGTLIWQSELTQVLTVHAEKLGVQIQLGHEVVAIAPGADEVAVITRTAAGDERLTARYHVGCDGGRSTVRKLAGFAFPGTAPLLQTIAGRVRFADPDRVPAGGRYPAGTFLRGGSMAGTTELAGTTAMPDEPVSAAELAASIGRVTGTAVQIDELREPRRISDHARQAATYRIGRVLLAGDAAHVHSPSGGQGLNLGLLDAANLGWKLAAAVRGEPGVEALLDTYTRERHPAGAAVLRNTRAQSALLAPGPHVDALREIVGELLDVPEANRFFVDLLSGVNGRYALPYPTDGQPGSTGQHCADLELADGTRLHEHTRTGRGLLVLPPEWPELASHVAGRVDVVAARPGGEPMLLRPDGVVAWAAEQGGPADVPALGVALRTWFGG